LILLVLFLYANRYAQAAFWVLVSVGTKLVPGYCHGTRLAAKVDAQVVCELVSQRLPTLHARLTQLRFPLAEKVQGWLVSFFTTILPLQVVVKVWDALFCEGSIILVGVGLSLLTLAERDFAEELSNASSVEEVDRVLLIAGRGAVTR
jgi:hypothetical protein